MLDLDDALERLAELDPRKGSLVELRYFAGLSIEEAAESLGVSPATAKREWRLARAWLRRELDRGTRSDGVAASSGGPSKQIFHAALERPPDERAAFLDEACAGDPDAPPRGGVAARGGRGRRRGARRLGRRRWDRVIRGLWARSPTSPTASRPRSAAPTGSSASSRPAA